MSMLASFRALVAESRVAALIIEPHLYVVEDGAASFRTRSEYAVSGLALEGRREGRHEKEQRNGQTCAKGLVLYGDYTVTTAILRLRHKWSRQGVPELNRAVSRHKSSALREEVSETD